MRNQYYHHTNPHFTDGGNFPWKVVSLRLAAPTLWYQLEATTNHSSLPNVKYVPHISWDIPLGNCGWNVTRSGSSPIPVFLSSLKTKRGFFLAVAFGIFFLISKVQGILQGLWNYSNRNPDKCSVVLSLAAASNHINTLLAPTCPRFPQGFYSGQLVVRGLILNRLIGI